MPKKSKKQPPAGPGIRMVETGLTARVDDLVEYERNAKIHTPEQIAQICESIRQFGFLDPIGVGAGNIIVEGHGRLYAARKLGMDVVPIIDLSHLTPGQQQAYILAHNKLTMNTGFDDIRYAEELAQIMIELPDLDVTALGIYEKQMEADIKRQTQQPAGGDGDGGGDKTPAPGAVTIVVSMSRADFKVWRKYCSVFPSDIEAFRQLLVKAKVS